ncbi:MAG TPA: periplasmic heavy metal sensor [Candidatus Limnocylindria bacterium]|nr:periplasmic heavy metal sensor [Candidatus Limnocylindria bacterium]
MRNRLQTITAWLIGAGMVAMATFTSAGQISLAAQPATDPSHAAHVAAAASPPNAAAGDAALWHQISQLQAKVAQLEGSLAKSPAPMTAAPAGPPMAGTSNPTASVTPAMNMGMGKMKPGGDMQGMGAATAPPMAGMGGGAASAGGAMGMMGMMDKMMGMMDKMMSMGGGATSAGAPMAGGGMGMMDMDMMKMGGGGSAPTAGMSGGGGMGMDKMEMAGMMGMGGMGKGTSMPQSALPGFPGASHLYHIGATGFFLDHPQHIVLTTQQKAALNQAKEQAALAKGTADRAIEQAEQELWTLTAADQPDVAKIEAKLAEIGKLRTDERLSFIRAVGDASKLLTDEQRNILTGFAPPAAADPMAGGMKDM